MNKRRKKRHNFITIEDWGAQVLLPLLYSLTILMASRLLEDEKECDSGISSSNRTPGYQSSGASPPDSLFDHNGLPPGLFVDPPAKEFLCSTCELYLNHPMVADCGDRFCLSCIHDLTSAQNNPECPACGEPIDRTTVVKDPFAKRQLEKQVVYCTNREYGCDSQQPLKGLQKHLTECEFVTVPCPKGCSERVFQRKLETHLREECENRLVECHLCKKDVMYKDLKQHQMECEEDLLMCPKCRLQVNRHRMAEHDERDCEGQIVECEYKSAGCSYTGLRGQITAHLEANKDEHMMLLLQRQSEQESRIAELQRAFEGMSLSGAVGPASSELASIQKQNEGVKGMLLKMQTSLVQRFEKVNKLEKAMEGTATKSAMAEQASKVENLQSAREDHEKRIQKLEEKANFRKDGKGKVAQTTDQRLNTLETQLSLHAMRLAEHDVRFQVHGTTSYNGVLVWKIKDFARRKRDADLGKTLSLYSQPFFTSRYGYKMCARVYLNGDGIGKDTHISLFFVIMKGDYDALLPWPFRQKVTLMLLDQESGRRHLSDSFRPDPSSTSFQRPTGEMNIASGCPLFVNQTVLQDLAYLRDDVIFLKVIVDTTDLMGL